MTTKIINTLMLMMFTSFITVDVNALSTDKQQPAIISADDVEFDFSTGVRIYRGNVKLDQGTMKLRADKLIVEYNNEVLQRATAFGNPATFQQRPDGKPKDMIGKGKKLELDEIKNIVTITENAFVDNGEGTATGNIITYDITNDKMKIIGATLKQEANASSPVKKENGRSKITISAEERKKAQEAEGDDQEAAQGDDDQEQAQGDDQEDAEGDDQEQAQEENQEEIQEAAQEAAEE